MKFHQKTIFTGAFENPQQPKKYKSVENVLAIVDCLEALTYSYRSHIQAEQTRQECSKP